MFDTFEQIVITDVVYGGLHLRFNEPVTFDAYQGEVDYWSISSDEWNLFVSGSSKEELIEELNEDFAFQWKEYALEDDVNLDEGARQLKQFLLSKITEAGINN